MHQALYRKWRPADFSSVVGQEHITSVLQHEVSVGKLNHAYLFCGSRGTGKTSCAKILAKAANCKHTVNGNPCNVCESCRSIDNGTSLDVLEMDAASNTGVDYIRDIREEVIFTPSDMSTRVYIIDEVHMLSEGAFNALLKTLEEPPSKVIFILATTELQKIPATILSRCQRFDFRRIALSDIIARLTYIAKEENIHLEDEGARVIARLAQGGMRDAISMLELCASEGGVVTAQRVMDKAGVCGRETVIDVVMKVTERDYAALFEAVSKVYRSSRDLSVFFSDILMLYRDMMVIRAMRLDSTSKIDPEILDVSENEFNSLYELALKFKYPVMVYHSSLLKDAISSMKNSNDKRVIAEMTLVKMASKAEGSSNEALSARISQLEERLAKGSFSPAMQTQATNEPIKAQPKSPSVNEASVKETLSSEVLQSFNEDEEYMGWIELVSEYEKLDAGSAPFLRSAAAYLKNTQLTVKLGDAFAISLLEAARADSKLLSCAASLGENISSVKFLHSTEIKKSKSSLDDLM